MFKHILIPTDGSDLSTNAVRQGLALAKSINASVTCLYVLPHLHMIQNPDEGSRAELNRLGEELNKPKAEEHARKVLEPLERLAANEGVKCATTHTTSNIPYQAIIDTAHKLKCDLILMASHGRSGLQAVLLGSETTKVLTHSKLPVLVVR